MKAFKQINLSREKQALTVYVSILSIVCSVIIISPVFAGNLSERLVNESETKSVNFHAGSGLSDFFVLAGRCDIHDDTPEQLMSSKSKEDSLAEYSYYDWYMLGYFNGLLKGYRHGLAPHLQLRGGAEKFQLNSSKGKEPGKNYPGRNHYSGTVNH